MLILVEGSFLFLKMEGHAASSPSHLKSWVTKIRTGAGEMSNAELNALSKVSKWGITERGAENFSNKYKAFLKAIGLKGKTTTFAQVIAKLRELLPTVSIPQGNGVNSLELYFDRIYVMINANTHVRNSTIYQPLMDAKADIYGIVEDLVADNLRMPSDGVTHMGMDRVFREVRVDPAIIDASINKFYHAVKAIDYADVVLRNT